MNAIWLIMLPYVVFADVSEFDKFCMSNASGSTNVTTEKTRVPICRDSESDGINITVSVECALPEPALRVSVFHCENQTAKVVICESSDTFARCNFSFSIEDMKKRFICVKYERNGAVPFQVRDFDINTCTCDTPTSMPNPQTTSQPDTDNETTSSPTLCTNTFACINNETDGGFRWSAGSFGIGLAVGVAVGIIAAVVGIKFCIPLICKKVKGPPMLECDQDRQPVRVGTDGNETEEDRVDTAAIVDDSNSHDSTGEMALLKMRKRPRKLNSDRTCTVGTVTVEEARERDSYLPQTFPIQQEASGGGTLVSMDGPQV